MRRILVDHARRRKSEKRGGGLVAVSIDAAFDIAVVEDLDVVALDVALEGLEKVFPQQAKLVELRFYGGLTIDETALVLGVSAATVSREWTMARAWLRRALSQTAIAMTDTFWERVRMLFHDASERYDAARAELLAEADPRVRAEVESLLSAHDEATPFLEKSVWN